MTAMPTSRRARSDTAQRLGRVGPGSRIEYKFEVIAGGQRQLLVDPLNPVLAHDPFGANSVCQGAGYERPAWTFHDAEARVIGHAPGTGKHKRRSARHFVTRLRRVLNRAQDPPPNSPSHLCLDC